jgi:hypothetical protein
MSKLIPITDQKISDKIYLLGGKRVMMDFDLAELYRVETGYLKRQVRRNMSRSPEDFMFGIEREEYNSLRRQFGILKRGAAIQVSIQIIRVFTRMREFLSENKDIFLKMEIFEKTFLKHNKKLSKHEKEIQIIFAALKRLINPPISPRKRIGFRITKDKDYPECF